MRRSKKKPSAVGPEVTTSKRLALFLLCLASFIAVVDTTIVSIALPSMRRELRFTGADAGWILNGYALTFGGLVLLLGRAGDLYGRRRLLVAGLALFGAASLVGGFAWEPWILVTARFIQGVGAAALVPASLSLPRPGRGADSHLGARIAHLRHLRGARERLVVHRDPRFRHFGHAIHGLFCRSRTPLICAASTPW